MLDNFLTSLDEWDEILSYLEVSLEDDDEKVVKEKRKAISAIALLSPKLTELALNALWKNMTTLVPIVEVVNSDGEFLDYYRVLNGRGCWVSHIRSESSSSLKHSTSSASLRIWK